jgi:hypothetical protein
MKRITEKTILKKGDKEYFPIRVDEIIYWCSNGDIFPGEAYLALETNYSTGQKERWVLYYLNTELNGSKQLEIVAQSHPKVDGKPVISLEAHNTMLIMEDECPIDLNSYSLKDIEKTVRLTRGSDTPIEIIIEKVNEISVIELDEFYNIISYE